MTGHIDLSLERRKRQPDYVDREKIMAAVRDGRAQVDKIVRESMDRFGAIDPIAYAISAHLDAVERLVSSDDEGGAAS